MSKSKSGARNGRSAKQRGKSASSKGTAAPSGKTLADLADRHELYLASVQDPEHEVEFLARAYVDAFGPMRPPTLLREDFCGTAAVCYQWVKDQPQREAIGVDIDPDPLEWGQRKLTDKLTPAERKRVKLLTADVRKIDRRKADIVAAQNFSFWIFKTRQQVREYFEAAYRNLKKEGIFLLDMMGGPDSLTEDHKDVRTITGPSCKFKYVWEQVRFDPITHDCEFHISFRFSDGSRLKRAFSYHWRYWSIPEVRELLLEAGFDRVHTYWEDTDDQGDGSGEYSLHDHAANDPSWVTYMVGIKAK